MSVFVAFLIMFVPILFIYGLIDFLSYRKWTSVYTALDDESYFQVIGKLKQVGIRYKTKSNMNLTITPFGGNRQRHYDIYVKKDDADIAHHKLNS